MSKVATQRNVAGPEGLDLDLTLNLVDHGQDPKLWVEEASLGEEVYGYSRPELSISF